ncbi:MAG: SRPBCC domain-containing protein [Chloroflexota bacterium]
MQKLFVDMSIEINASAPRVWDVLTLRQHTAEWASEFAAGGPQISIESDWGLGNAVLWRDERGHVIVEGHVTAVELHGMLRFTVFDVRGERHPASADDGITFKLTERDDRTRLWVSQGDFSTIADGEKYRDLSAQIWNRALARIKRLAENNAEAWQLPEDRFG